MRVGRRAAIDVGTVRVGVAVCDREGILASGLSTIPRNADAKICASEILAALTDIEPIEIYVGLPISLSGNETASTKDALQIARELEAITSVPVRLIDERLTTVTAGNALRASGKSSKSGRSIIDQIAATVILEQALSYEKSSGAVPGRELSND